MGLWRLSRVKYGAQCVKWRKIWEFGGYVEENMGLKVSSGGKYGNLGVK